MRKLLACALVLGGCAMGPDYKRPDVVLPPAYPDATTDTIPTVQSEWWKLYGDATLDGLVAEALVKNNDVRFAAAQVEEAEALLRLADTSYFPEIDLGAAGNRARVSNLLAVPNPAGTPVVRNDRRVALSTSFEIDFWGRIRRAAESARAQALSTTYGRDVVMLGVASLTTQAYFALRSSDAQILALRDSLRTREESLEVARSRASAGLVSDLDVYQAQSARADVASQLKEIERQRDVFEHQLATLTGRLDLHLTPGDITAMPLPPLPPAGLPSRLLERRPDVRAAEQTLVAANAQIGVAKAALFPTISLIGSYGGESAELSDILKTGARIWSAGFGLTLPIFDAGRGFARVDQAAARRNQALFAYQKAIETAFREVADAITNVRQSTSAEADLKERVDASRNSLDLARARYGAGYSPYLEVLDAQRTLNDAEQALVRNRQLQLSYTVDFIKALGGGWAP
jgi:outer membrane protein, multidrug efflux system